MTETTAQAPPAGAPTPFMKGIFALYETPDGGILISYRPDDATADQHQYIPAALVSLARAAQENGGSINPMDLWRAVRGGKAARGDGVE